MAGTRSPPPVAGIGLGVGVSVEIGDVVTVEVMVTVALGVEVGAAELNAPQADAVARRAATSGR